MLLNEFEVMQTRDVEAARQTLIRRFGASHFELTDAAGGFEASASVAPLGDVTICSCSYSTGVQLGFSASPTVRQLICLSGSGHAVIGARRVDFDAQNWSVVIPSGVPVDFTFSANFRLLVVWIDSGRLDRTITALWGTPRTGALVARQSDPTSPALLALRRAVEFAISELEIVGSKSSPVALAEMQDLIVTRFLYGHYADFVDGAAREPLMPSRPQMRHLEDYLKTHWNEPATVDKLAQIANVGARSIFRYFKQVHGATPLDFMKTLRLQEVRRGLLRPHDATSVSSEALRCGFNNMGHFAKDYRRKFGELPSETLATARARAYRSLFPEAGISEVAG
ncbi:MAG: AraC family transcriptional regulator [Xanthobacteraceae bacterium]|nr:AraC family transcriptional regulator [Xanthobacteraceae bacterium]